MKTDAATLKRVYAMSLAGVYPHYVAKAEKKGRTKAEVDEIIRWLTGYTQKQLESILEKRTNIETFISKARMNPSRTLVTGSICGVRVEEIEDPGHAGSPLPRQADRRAGQRQADGKDPISAVAKCRASSVPRGTDCRWAEPAAAARDLARSDHKSRAASRDVDSARAPLHGESAARSRLSIVNCGRWPAGTKPNTAP
jgi:hypothetical protein